MMSPPFDPSITSAPVPPLIVSPTVVLSVPVIMSAPTPALIVNDESSSASASSVNAPVIVEALIVPATDWKLPSANVIEAVLADESVVRVITSILLTLVRVVEPRLPPSSLILSVSVPAPAANTSAATNESSNVSNKSSPAPEVTESVVELAAVFLYVTLFAEPRPAAETVVAPAVSASRIVNDVEPLFVYTSLLNVNELAPVPPNEILSIPEILLKSDAATVVVAFSSNKIVSRTPAPPLTFSAVTRPIKSETSSILKISLPAPPINVSIPLPPVIVSAPAPPLIISAFTPPVRISAPLPPVIVIVESSSAEPSKVIAPVPVDEEASNTPFTAAVAVVTNVASTIVTPAVSVPRAVTVIFSTFDTNVNVAAVILFVAAVIARVSVPAPPLTVSLASRAAALPNVENLKISSPAPPVRLSLILAALFAVTSILFAELTVEALTVNAAVVSWSLILMDVDPLLVKNVSSSVIFAVLFPSNSITSIFLRLCRSVFDIVVAVFSVNESVSVPSPPSTVSGDAREIKSVTVSTLIWSFPAPASILSTPAPPLRISFPASPLMISAPAAPEIESIPPPPEIVSAADPPINVSAPFGEPIIVAGNKTVPELEDITRPDVPVIPDASTELSTVLELEPRLIPFEPLKVIVVVEAFVTAPVVISPIGEPFVIFTVSY